MNYLTAAGVGAGIGVIGFWLLANIVHTWKSRLRPTRQTPDIERRFRAVFSVMTEDRRQSLIRYYMEKHECDRQAAMRFAVDDRARDADRWAT
ncbi:hypothetical protein [Rhizobium rhododendri]|uniref:Transmembrane protein n=1 Tax=Rhizobium rhododendri TaxID=2506430 RepID=A0ABY8IK54_9HYPH|nr:hypothetical protein [Rhizobium rhododendri]WFS23919.1 hypothetical protein PR018_05310 [Rhizobium rhododendri]